MNYYPFHIGDYRSGTAHLTDAEDLAYRRALDWYYDTETLIPLDTQWVARRLRVDTQVLENVLRDFFLKTEEGWQHERCDEEIAAYQKLRDKNRANGAKGGRRPKQMQPIGNPVGSQSDSDGEAMETQALANQEPITNISTTDVVDTPRKRSSVPTKPADVDQQTWDDFLTMRNKMRAAVTQTAIDGIAREAAKAGVTLAAALSVCCTNGWRGFKAEWLDRQEARQKQPVKSFAQQDREAGWLHWEEMTGRKHPEMEKVRAERGEIHSGQVIDITPRPDLLTFEGIER